MQKQNSLFRDTSGDAVVEATILFPIIIMIFAGLVLLAMYLPTRAVLQRETQYAATALATEKSDTWLEFDEDRMMYYWESELPADKNVYVMLFSSFLNGDNEERAGTIVETMEENRLISRSGELTVECKVNNYIIYQEIVVTASRTIPMPVDLSFVKFPTEIPITVSSTAVVQNGDEFVRDIDIAADFISYLLARYDVDLSELSKAVNKVWEFLGI